MAGKSRLRTNIPDAARAKAMHEAGIRIGEIVEATGVSQRVIYDIVHGVGKWGQIVHNDERFKQYRDEVKKQLQTGSLELSKKCLTQIEDKLPQASAAQAAVVYGIIFDKERLQAGESSLNVAVINKRDLEDEDALLARLAASMIEDKVSKGE